MPSFGWSLLTTYRTVTEHFEPLTGYRLAIDKFLPTWANTMYLPNYFTFVVKDDEHHINRVNIFNDFQ